MNSELKKFIEQHQDLLDTDLEKLYYYCPRRLRTELAQVLETSNIHVPQSHITEADVLPLLKQWKNTTDGSVTVRNRGVRYTDYEDDLSMYVTLDNLVKNIQQDHVPLEELQEDSGLLADYFDEEIFVHTYADVPEYKRQKQNLNQKYLGTNSKSAFDGSWMTVGTEFKNLDHPSWIYKITAADPSNTTNAYVPKHPTDYVWYNKATPATKMQFLPEHNTACKAQVFDKLMREGKIQIQVD